MSKRRNEHRHSSGNRNYNRKYDRRPVGNNWDRYKQENVIDESEKKEEEKADDFVDLVNIPSDCNYFQFKSEKNWDNEASCSTFSGHKFFNLDLEVLSYGLACLPFYERVDIDKSMLSQSDVERCDNDANESLLKYKEVKKNFVEKLQRDYELPGLVEKIGEITLESKKDKPQSIHSDIDSILTDVEALIGFSQNAKLVNSETECGKSVNENKADESLEDWLDSVLGD